MYSSFLVGEGVGRIEEMIQRTRAQVFPDGKLHRTEGKITGSSSERDQCVANVDILDTGRQDPDSPVCRQGPGG